MNESTSIVLLIQIAIFTVGLCYFLIELLKTKQVQNRMSNKYMGHLLEQLEQINQTLGYINTNLAIENVQDTINKENFINDEINGDHWIMKGPGEPLDADIVCDRDGNEGIVEDNDYVRMQCRFEACKKPFNHKIKVSFDADMKYCPQCGNKQ